MTAPEPLSVEERALVRMLARSKDIDGKQAMEIHPRLVLALVEQADTVQAVEADREALREALVDALELAEESWGHPVLSDRRPHEEFARLYTIALTGEEPTDA